MVTCTGRGDSGDHCCYIAGEICPLLFIDRGGTPRCSVWDNWDSPEYKESAAAAFMAQYGEGFTCADWPQNIPAVMKTGIGLCCWSNG